MKKEGIKKKTKENRLKELFKKKRGKMEKLYSSRGRNIQYKMSMNSFWEQ